jgi:hypothetical protein
MNNLYVHEVDSIKKIVNGKIVDDVMVNANYDGSNLDIQTYNKGKRDHFKLDNKDIMKIMSRPASSMSLEKRLMHDFSVKNIKKKVNRKISKKTKKRRKYRR